MNRYFLSLFFVLILMMKDSVKAIGELLPQIKVTRTQLWYVDPAQYEKFTLSINKHNATFNNVLMDVMLKDRVTADVFVEVSVYVTDSNYSNEKLLLEEKIPLCMEHPHRYLLPEGMIVPDSELNRECFKNGGIHSGNFNNFRFEQLVPNIHEISDYYFVNFVLQTKTGICCKLTLYSEWGYLNTD